MINKRNRDAAALAKKQMVDAAIRLLTVWMTANSLLFFLATHLFADSFTTVIALWAVVMLDSIGALILLVRIVVAFDRNRGA